MNVINNNFRGKIKKFISNINNINISLATFNSKLQLLYEYESVILEQLNNKISNCSETINNQNNEDTEKLNKYRNNNSKENKEDQLYQLIEKSEEVLNHPFIKSQHKIKELTNKNKKKQENIITKNDKLTVNKKDNDNVNNHIKKGENISNSITNNFIKIPKKKKINIPSQVTTKYEEHFNKLNSVYETFKNSKIALLEFLSNMTENEHNLDILINQMNCLLQKYSLISEILLNDDISKNYDDTLINELYILTEMSEYFENQTLNNYNNICKSSLILNNKWKEHISNIEKECYELNNNNIYYYNSLSELLKHAKISFEIQKAELEYKIQNYLKNELIPQLDNIDITDEEFLQYYKLLSGLIKDVNNIEFPIIIKK
ncbi:hypothetical protein BCR32DRAFT_272459 [Anaeromyces robustus]|uniref:Uncharacterized protein n=1 Tax=Anaeromyces robustus TaxID=1754192 RepID=A0A1Y1W721_9FUNG|nr:hypothetical protein BCR32DRAFT_272459 [Anaeromyces robustus]|eukprot:ORX69321.1 hypothetical protein BCR32DRAFT_272459 [Anaeromyces robustus]